MSINTKAIKNRINSVKNTYKVTKSMEKISGIKRAKFVNLTTNSKEYTNELVITNNIFSNQIVVDEDSSELVKKRDVKNILVVVLTSDRGLCGSFNSNVINTAVNYIKEIKVKDNQISVLALGKKGAKVANLTDTNLVGVYDRLYEADLYERSFEISRNIVNKYSMKECDEVVFIYTAFQSLTVQNINIEKLLPFEVKNENTDEITSNEEYVVEPNNSELQEYILLKTIDCKIYQSILESNASEHSSRMVAMKNASDNASELSDILTLAFNKGRQAMITQEVSEIVAGIEALADFNS